MDGADPQALAVSGRPTIRALAGIRAVATGWVVFHHFREPVFALLPALRPAERWLLAPVCAAGAGAGAHYGVEEPARRLIRRLGERAGQRVDT